MLWSVFCCVSWLGGQKRGHSNWRKLLWPSASLTGKVNKINQPKNLLQITFQQPYPPVFEVRFRNPVLVPCKLFKYAMGKTKRQLFLQNCLNLPWRRQKYLLLGNGLKNLPWRRQEDNICTPFLSMLKNLKSRSWRFHSPVQSKVLILQFHNLDLSILE